MSVQTITSTPVLVAATDTYLSSAQTFPVKVQLLTVGQGSDHSEGDEIRFEATGGSIIEVVDSNGKRVGIVPGEGEAVAVAVADGDPGLWRFTVLANSPSAFQSISASPTQGEVEALRNCLRDHGLMKAE